MEILFILITVLIGSLMTFFSGFGLGTILLPVFCLFFPIEIAVFATAIVHFCNSFFKLIFIFRNINFPIILKFGSTAIPFAIIGAYLLNQFNSSHFAIHYNFSFYQKNVSLINFLMGLTMICFALVEFFLKNKKAKPSSKSLFFGGIISGFFGGFSGHQGAFRAMFLTKTEISKEEFVATSSCIGFLVDLTRIGIYFSSFNLFNHGNISITLSLSIIVAFAGSYFGSKLLQKTTLKSIQFMVALLLLLLGSLLIIGVI